MGDIGATSVAVVHGHPVGAAEGGGSSRAAGTVGESQTALAMGVKVR